MTKHSPRCLRCGAGPEWIEGEAPVSDLRKDNYEQFLRDLADTDTEIRNLARPHLAPLDVDGDKEGSPGMADVVELLVKKLESANAKIAEYESRVQPDNDPQDPKSGYPSTVNDYLSLLAGYLTDAVPDENVGDDKFWAWHDEFERRWTGWARPLVAEIIGQRDEARAKIAAMEADIRTLRAEIFDAKFDPEIELRDKVDALVFVTSMIDSLPAIGGVK